MKKMCAILALVFFFTFGAAIAVPTPAQADTLDAIIDVLDAVSYYTYVRETTKYIDNNMQSQMFQKLKKEHGVSSDPAANEMLHRIFTRIGAAAGNSEVLTKPPSYFVNPKQSINAFRAVGNVISINAGVFNEFGFNEDMVAFIVAHEIGHGTKQHALRTIEGLVSLKMAAYLYAKRYQDYLQPYQLELASVIILHISRKGYSVPFEYEADNAAFEYGVNAGYNPGAAAANGVRMLSFYGGERQSLFNALFNPSTHPPTQKRIENFSTKLTEYSRGAVMVSGAIVNVNGQKFVETKTIGSRLAEERAFLVAGNLARIFHRYLRPIEPAIVEFGTLKLAGQNIITPVPGEPTAEELQDRINRILGFPSATPNQPASQAPKSQNPQWIAL